MTSTTSLARRAALMGTAAALTAALAIPAAAGAQDETAKVRVGHFSPDAPAVDIYANGEILAGLEDVPFGVLSDYIEVPADTYEIAVVVADQDPAEATVIGPADIPFEAGSIQTIAATGFASGQDPALAPLILDDDYVLGDGNAQVRVVHLSPDAPAVDIAPDGAEALIPNLAFGEFAGYVGLEPGEYDLEVRVAGEDAVALQLDPLTLSDNTAYTVFAIGSAADPELPALQPLVVVDDALAMVRVGHFSADAPPVDVYANGAILGGLEGVPFGDLSDYLAVPAGTYDIAVTVAGEELAETNVIDAQITLAPGSMTTVAATNDVANIAPVVLNEKKVTPRADGAKVRVVHLSANAPKVDIAPDGSKRKAAIFKNLKFGNAKGYKNVPAGEIDLDVRAAGERAKAFDIPPMTLEDGKAYSAIAIGQFPDSFKVILVEEASIN